MANLKPQRFFYSLRVRYAGIAILFALIILFSAALAYYSLNDIRYSINDSLEGRQRLQLVTRQIRDTLWHAHESLQLFLFNPSHEPYRDDVHKSINQAIAYTDNLFNRGTDLPDTQKANIQNLKTQLIKFDGTVGRLIKVRINAIEQYPSLKPAMGIMLNLNIDFISASSLAIDEAYENITSGQNRGSYDLFVHARHTWSQMISSFRMYLANRLGTFDNTIFATQTNNIEFQYASLLQQLNRLQKLDEQHQLELQGTNSLRLMQGMAHEWYKEYMNVRKIHESNAWRTDSLLITSEVTPQIETIWSNLKDIDLSIEDSAEQDLNLLTRTAQDQVDSFWFAAGLALLFVSLSYFLLDKSVLRPLSMLTRLIKAETHGTDTHTLPRVSSLETQDLLDAFAEMRHEIHRRQTALEHQALHDALTGLANRTLLMDRLQQGIQHCNRHKSSLALLIIDLNGFKEVNDTLGHQIGDRLLEQVANRLRESLRDIDTVARLGGDEFAVLLPDDTAKEAAEVAQKIIHILSDEFRIDDSQLYISASIGIAAHPQHAANMEELIKFADMAMYMAKRNRLGYIIYNSKHNANRLNQLSLSSDLRNALDDNDFQLVFQPKLNVRSGAIIGVEALFRWRHYKLGPIPAIDAIDLAEQTGLIHQLTVWTTEEAIRTHAQWQKAGIDLPISINLSVYCLQSKPVMDHILSWIESSHFDPGKFIFEITESAMMVEPQHAIDAMERITRMGARLSIDDFGTGFSSLAYLKRMPVHELKIDKSFVIDMLENDNDAIIVRSIIDLAHNIGLKVVAEGVENLPSWQLLQILKCDIAQGNYLCPPLSAKGFIPWYQHKYQDNRRLETLS